MGSPLSEVLEAFQALLDERAQVPSARDAGRGNFRCERCEGCSHCRFCTDCTDCEDCTYCDGCSDCSGCTHCKDCERCSQTTHSAWSSACKDCSYVTLCLDCSGCVQCFACVGLRNEEFCVLNEKLPRKTYFSRVAELRGAFEARVAEGWRPPWMVEEVEDEEDEVEDEDEEVEDEEVEEVEVPEEEPEAAVIIPDPLPADSSTALQLSALWGSELADAVPAAPTSDVGSGPILFESPRTEPTVDTGEPVEKTQPRPTTSPWSFPEARRGHSAEPEDDAEPTVIPEPPPFGAADEEEHEGVGMPGRRSALGADRARRRTPASPSSDRYSWSAQTEGTPASPGWRASELGPQRERPPPEPAAESTPSRRWRDPDYERSRPRRWSELDEPEHSPPPRRVGAQRSPAPRRGWSAEAKLERAPLPRWESGQREQETRPSRPHGEGGFMSRGWSSGESERETQARSAPEKPRATAKTAEPQALASDEPRRGEPRERRERWGADRSIGEPERRRLESDTALNRRRRETAATPSARPLDEPPRARVEPPSAPVEQASDVLQRELDEWLPYDDARRSSLGPDEQTEPDAPVVGRGPARAEISGAARASSALSSSVGSVDDRRTTGPRPAPKNSLGCARRPERPRPPEPRERGALLRGRAPARPTAPARQSDAPSLRQARRPARSREETTSKFRAAVLIEGEPDPGTS